MIPLQSFHNFRYKRELVKTCKYFLFIIVKTHLCILFLHIDELFIQLCLEKLQGVLPGGRGHFLPHSQVSIMAQKQGSILSFFKKAPKKQDDSPQPDRSKNVLTPKQNKKSSPPGSASKSGEIHRLIDVCLSPLPMCVSSEKPKEGKRDRVSISPFLVLEKTVFHERRDLWFASPHRYHPPLANQARTVKRPPLGICRPSH